LIDIGVFWLTQIISSVFKKGVGCSFASRTVHIIVDYYVTKDSIVNLGAINVSKEFDRDNSI